MPQPSPADGHPPGRREVKITVFASIGVDDPPPDSLEALRRLLTEHPDRVEVYDVSDAAPERVGAIATAPRLEEGSVVEIPEPTEQSLGGRAPEHREHVLAARALLVAPISITGTDSAEKIVVTDSEGQARWLFFSDVRSVSTSAESR